jgi:N-formylglutamate amidohydrolase
MVADAYVLTLPDARATSVLFSSPHSGCDYPSEFLARSVLDERAIRSSEDAFVDRLFASAPARARRFSPRGRRGRISISTGPRTSSIRR